MSANNGGDFTGVAAEVIRGFYIVLRPTAPQVLLQSLASAKTLICFFFFFKCEL